MEVTKAGLSTLSKTSYNTKKDDTTADKIKDGIKDNSRQDKRRYKRQQHKNYCRLISTWCYGFGCTCYKER